MCGSNLYLISSNRGTAGAPDTVRAATHARYNSKTSSTCNFLHSAVISFSRLPSNLNCNHAECSALYRTCQDYHRRPIEGELQSVVHTSSHPSCTQVTHVFRNSTAKVMNSEDLPISYTNNFSRRIFSFSFI